MIASTALRRLLAQPGPVVIPGCYDCISALAIERAGFPAGFVSGAAVTASVLGYPDVGLQTMPEILNQVRNMASRTLIPLLVDVDTGYGNALNVMRTVRAFEAAGAGGIFFEDQSFPKRCGHFEGKTVIPTEEMVVKVKAACAARRNPDFVIVARTDARTTHGLSEAIDRGLAYAAAGADAIFVEALLDEGEMREVATRIPAPLQANLNEGDKTPVLHFDLLHRIGFKIISYSGLLQRTALKGMLHSLETLQREGSALSLYPSRVSSLAERSAFLGLDRFYRLEEELYHPIVDSAKSWRGELTELAWRRDTGDPIPV